MYEADDKMISIIRDNYNILQSLGSFGINLGFGDKTVREVCEEQAVDTYTFLAVVNFTINGYKEYDNASRLSLPTLLHRMLTTLIFSCLSSAKSWWRRSTRTTIWPDLFSNYTMSMRTASPII